MTDIVFRLKRLDEQHWRSLAYEAANEIERLREALRYYACDCKEDDCSTKGGRTIKWQPIETAPKDGTDILVMYIHISTQCVFNAFWRNYEEGLNDPEDEGWWSYVWSEVGRYQLSGHQTPTHWMPLPQPPQEKE